MVNTDSKLAEFLSFFLFSSVREPFYDKTKQCMASEHKTDGLQIEPNTIILRLYMSQLCCILNT